MQGSTTFLGQGSYLGVFKTVVGTTKYQCHRRKTVNELSPQIRQVTYTYIKAKYRQKRRKPPTQHPHTPPRRPHALCWGSQSSLTAGNLSFLNQELRGVGGRKCFAPCPSRNGTKNKQLTSNLTLATTVFLLPSLILGSCVIVK